MRPSSSKNLIDLPTFGNGNASKNGDGNTSQPQASKSKYQGYLANLWNNVKKPEATQTVAPASKSLPKQPKGGINVDLDDISDVADLISLDSPVINEISVRTDGKSKKDDSIIEDMFDMHSLSSLIDIEEELDLSRQTLGYTQINQPVMKPEQQTEPAQFHQVDPSIFQAMNNSPEISVISEVSTIQEASNSIAEEIASASESHRSQINTKISNEAKYEFDTFNEDSVSKSVSAVESSYIATQKRSPALPKQTSSSAEPSPEKIQSSKSSGSDGSTRSQSSKTKFTIPNRAYEPSTSSQNTTTVSDGKTGFPAETTKLEETATQMEKTQKSAITKDQSTNTSKDIKISELELKDTMIIDTIPSVMNFHRSLLGRHLDLIENLEQLQYQNYVRKIVVPK